MKTRCPDCSETDLLVVKLFGGYPKIGNYFVCHKHGWKWRDGRHIFGTFFKLRGNLSGHPDRGQRGDQ